MNQSSRNKQKNETLCLDRRLLPQRAKKRVKKTPFAYRIFIILRVLKSQKDLTVSSLYREYGIVNSNSPCLYFCLKDMLDAMFCGIHTLFNQSNTGVKLFDAGSSLLPVFFIY